MSDVHFFFPPFWCARAVTWNQLTSERWTSCANATLLSSLLFLLCIFFFASLSLLIAWQLTEWKWMPFNSTPFTSTWVFRYPHIAVINSEFIHAATPNFNTLTQLNVEWIKTASLWTSSTSSYKCMKMSRIKWKPNVPSTRFWTSNKSKRRL